MRKWIDNRQTVDASAAPGARTLRGAPVLVVWAPDFDRRCVCDNHYRIYLTRRGHHD